VLAEKYLGFRENSYDFLVVRNVYKLDFVNSFMDERMELDIVLIPEGNGKSKTYSIYSIQVPNVVTQGETIEEAKEMLKEALDLYFEEVPEEKKSLISIEKEERAVPLISRIFF